MILRDLKGEITGSAKWSRKWRRRVVGERERATLISGSEPSRKTFAHPSILSFSSPFKRARSQRERFVVRCAVCPFEGPLFATFPPKKDPPLFRERRNGYKAEGRVVFVLLFFSLPLFFSVLETGETDGGRLSEVPQIGEGGSGPLN